jgi:hypothetical protein
MEGFINKLNDTLSKVQQKPQLPAYTETNDTDLAEFQDPVNEATMSVNSQKSKDSKVSAHSGSAVSASKPPIPKVITTLNVKAINKALGKDLAELLAEINGQDCYDAKVAAVGKLSNAHYLFLPDTFTPVVPSISDIGKAGCVTNMDPLVWGQIYTLNKPVFDAGENGIKAALLRAELVSAGWVHGGYEVSYVPAPPDKDVVAALTADKDTIAAHILDAKKLALLLPLAAEHVFRTLGHHFLTAMAADYTDKYNRFFAACVMANLASYLPPDLLYHRVAHWVPLDRALSVTRDAGQRLRLPNAVVIRSTSGPAGTALITTSEAVLHALAQTGLRDALIDASGIEVKVITEMATLVRENPGKYHTIPTAYGHGVLSTDDQVALDAAKEIAIQIAPILQGFLDSLPRNSDLPQAKALAKHADTNPLLRKRAKVYFKEVGTTKASSMAELLAMDKRGLDVTGGTSAIDEDEA